MLTGRRPFRRDTPTLTLAAILHLEPPPLPAEIPQELGRIVARCLRKEPDRRFQHMADVKVALEELKQEIDSGALGVAGSTMTRARRHWLPWAAAAGVVFILVGAGMWLTSFRTTRPTAAFVPVPLTSYPGAENTPSFSPDGAQVAFAWCTDDLGMKCSIYVKQIGMEPPFRLTDTPASDYSPVWSPDGLSIAFLRQTKGNQANVVLRLRSGFDYPQGSSLGWQSRVMLTAPPAARERGRSGSRVDLQRGRW